MTTQATSLRHAGAAQRVRPGLVARVRAMLALRRQRRDLLAMDAHQLRDLGLTPDQARAEALRPVWDVPQTWRF